MDLLLGLWFYFIDQWVCLCTSTMQFYHYCFVVQLEFRDGDFPGSSFIIENCFEHPGGFLSMWSWELLFLCLWRTVLEFWWGLHCVCRFLLVRWPFLLCESYQSMSIGDLSTFWSLQLFFYKNLKFLSYRSFACLVIVAPRCIKMYYNNCGYCEGDCNFFLSLLVF